MKLVRATTRPICVLPRSMPDNVLRRLQCEVRSAPLVHKPVKARSRCGERCGAHPMRRGGGKMLEATLGAAMKAMWLGCGLYWVIAGRRAKATRWHENWFSRALDAGLLLVATILMLAGHRLPSLLCARFLPPGPAMPALGAALTALGLSFTIWARVHLGRNWSGTVTLKDDHALIRTGPYRQVRHPIYSGALLALAETVLAVGEWRGVVALALVFLAFLRRVRVEEKQLRAIFPDYDQYRRETAALVPFIY
jgi:protein-S-isoprenylcysteine O-methyltransferase Ste14